MYNWLMKFFSADMAIDLGTANTLIYVKGRGIVLNEPSVVAVAENRLMGRKEILAVGTEAKQMFGRTPGTISAVRPLRDGVIAEYDVTEKMLKYFISKASKKKSFVKPRVMICIPSGVTSVEERAVKQAALAAGAKEAYLIEEPVAAALGAGIDISEPNGSIVVDIGGGTTDIAVLALGGVVCSKSIRVGGDKFDEAIVRYIRRYYNLVIGERTAEELKKEIGSAYPSQLTQKSSEIKGRDLVTGLPKTVEISAEKVNEAITEQIEDIIAAIKEVLEKTPPELAADIAERGIVLTGGGSLLYGLEELIEEKTGIPTMTAEDPMTAVAIGTGKYVEFSAGYRDENL